MSSGCLCRRTKPTWTFHACVSSIRWPPEYESASTGGVIRAALRIPVTSRSLLLCGKRVAGQFFCKRWFSRVPIRAKLKQVV